MRWILVLIYSSKAGLRLRSKHTRVSAMLMQWSMDTGAGRVKGSWNCEGKYPSAWVSLDTFTPWPAAALGGGGEPGALGDSMDVGGGKGGGAVVPAAGGLGDGPARGGFTGLDGAAGVVVPLLTPRAAAASGGGALIGEPIGEGPPGLLGIDDCGVLPLLSAADFAGTGGTGTFLDCIHRASIMLSMSNTAGSVGVEAALVL